MGTVVRPVRFNEVEVAAVEGVRGDLTFNAWVRRACVRQAELERAVAAEAVSSVEVVARRVEVRRELVHGKDFKPDFGKRLKR